MDFQGVKLKDMDCIYLLMDRGKLQTLVSPNEGIFLPIQCTIR